MTEGETAEMPNDGARLMVLRSPHPALGHRRAIGPTEARRRQLPRLVTWLMTRLVTLLETRATSSSTPPFGRRQRCAAKGGAPVRNRFKVSFERAR